MLILSLKVNTYLPFNYLLKTVLKVLIKQNRLIIEKYKQFFYLTLGVKSNKQKFITISEILSVFA